MQVQGVFSDHGDVVMQNYLTREREESHKQIETSCELEKLKLAHEELKIQLTQTYEELERVLNSTPWTTLTLLRKVKSFFRS
jgi:hypothetical protein